MALFDTPARRSFLIPIILAVVSLTVAIVSLVHFFPTTTVNISHVETRLLPADITFKADSIVTGRDETQHLLFIATTVRIDNQLHFPVILDDFVLTLTDSSGAELTAHAPMPSGIAALQLTYPALKPLLAQPLARETTLNPGSSIQGTILFSLPIPQSLWNQRKSATIKTDIYHQPSVALLIPSASKSQ